jgi:hypothetical protein
VLVGWKIDFVRLEEEDRAVVADQRMFDGCGSDLLDLTFAVLGMNTLVGKSVL